MSKEFVYVFYTGMLLAKKDIEIMCWGVIDTNTFFGFDQASTSWLSFLKGGDFIESLSKCFEKMQLLKFWVGIGS